MITLDDLRAVRYSCLQIKSLEERIARLRSATEGCAAKPLGLFPGGGGRVRDKLGDDVARLLELEGRRRKQIIDLEMKMQEVDSWLDKLPPLQATVVRLYYVEGKTWRQIGRILNYHPDSCRKIRDTVICGIPESHPFSPASNVVIC